MNSEQGAAKKSQKATFVVQIQFRQNSTWQGSIDWIDKKVSQRFRSELELLRLMDDAVGTDNEDEYPVWEHDREEKERKL